MTYETEKNYSEAKVMIWKDFKSLKPVFLI